MSESSKTFDSVQSMRDARDRISSEVADMHYEELVQWLRAHKYADPLLQQLAEKAAGQSDERLGPRLGAGTQDADVTTHRDD